MSCANKTRSSTEGRSEQCVCRQPVKEGKSKKFRQKSRIVPDHNHTNPIYVWGDEGPVNEPRKTSHTRRENTR
jgi:hypothetical protein